VTCRFDGKRNRKIFYWDQHHHNYIEEWELFDANVDDNDELHTNSEYKRYQAWYHGVTRSRLRLQWSQADYADIESYEDEDTVYDHTTHVGRQVEAGPILDRVVCHLP
jgi:hypothetical protein